MARGEGVKEEHEHQQYGVSSLVYDLYGFDSVHTTPLAWVPPAS